MTTDLVTAAITKHGAKRVYDAAYRRLQGDRAPLAAVDLIAADLAQANAIMVQAFAGLTASQCAGDYWDANNEARNL